jgi:hypothetical protein
VGRFGETKKSGNKEYFGDDKGRGWFDVRFDLRSKVFHLRAQDSRTFTSFSAFGFRGKDRGAKVDPVPVSSTGQAFNARDG